MGFFDRPMCRENLYQLGRLFFERWLKKSSTSSQTASCTWTREDLLQREAGEVTGRAELPRLLRLGTGSAATEVTTLNLAHVAGRCHLLKVPCQHCFASRFPSPNDASIGLSTILGLEFFDKCVGAWYVACPNPCAVTLSR